ncbi:hypothetical protein L917_03670 [Phytophthora nicotianae]|uniref:Uncharacterized protein n=4 Tax=Phytophthora nicotianae TaxID=4792 RepID=V9FRP8_PHYNI|nr:hypothetical protein F443_03919 [Phytophthora nicotianae P1569]ETL99497.1 hypothetical protein L917_03670 [Phytophthora nicotianae]ETM52655.1 hypothetical protein L914_03770 [Phytophthora nicotianae]ETO81779.1 hypothetical protein F444_03983 [Phytophthora nicotianae P1976]
MMRLRRDRRLLNPHHIQVKINQGCDHQIRKVVANITETVFFPQKAQVPRNVLRLLRKKSPGAEEELPDKPAVTKSNTAGGLETRKPTSRRVEATTTRRRGSRLVRAQVRRGLSNVRWE